MGLIVYLEHGQEKMLFTRLVLVSVEGEHDGLEQGVDLCEGDEATEGGDMSWLCLEKEEEVSVGLQLAVVWEQSVGRVGLLQVLGDLALL